MHARYVLYISMCPILLSRLNSAQESDAAVVYL